jgi:hypothetical protein
MDRHIPATFACNRPIAPQRPATDDPRMPPDHGQPIDPALDKLIAELHSAGLLAVGRDRDGHATWTLTPDGSRLAGLLAAWADEGPSQRMTSLLEIVADPAGAGRR